MLPSDRSRLNNGYISRIGYILEMNYTGARIHPTPIFLNNYTLGRLTLTCITSIMTLLAYCLAA